MPINMSVDFYEIRNELIQLRYEHENVSKVSHNRAKEIVKLKAINDSLLNALKEVSDAWRGVNDIYLPPFQKATLKKVNDLLLAIQKASNE